MMTVARSVAQFDKADESRLSTGVHWLGEYFDRIAVPVVLWFSLRLRPRFEFRLLHSRWPLSA